MYLTYNEYCGMGGLLTETAFLPLCRQAEYIVNAQANGRTGERLKAFEEMPQAVKDCIFELVTHMAANSFDGSAIQSESHTLGSQSESVTYSRMTQEESKKELNMIIYNFLYSVKINGASILYAGASV